MSSKTVFGLTVAAVALAMSLPMVAQAKDKQAKPAVPMTFQITDTTKIMLADKAAGTLADLKAGEKVKVAYDDNAGTLTAVSVHLAQPKGEKPKGEKGGEHKKGDKAPEHKHAKGTVTAVDATAKTLTVEVVEHHHAEK